MPTPYEKDTSPGSRPLEEISVPGVGRFTIRANGRARIVFNDGTCLDVFVDLDRHSSSEQYHVSLQVLALHISYLFYHHYYRLTSRDRYPLRTTPSLKTTPSLPHWGSDEESPVVHSLSPLPHSQLPNSSTTMQFLYALKFVSRVFWIV